MSMSLNATPPDAPWVPVKYVFISIDLLMMVAICFGNGLVLIAYKKTNKLQKTANLMLINLSCADLVTGAIVVPWMCADYYWTNGYSSGKIACVTFFVVCHIPLGVSGLTMFMIAILRFLAVMYPLKHKALVTRGRIKIVMGLIWVYMTTLVVPFVVYGNNFEASGGRCNFFWVLPIEYVATVAGHMGVVGFAAAAMYVYIGYTVVQRGKMVRSMSQGEWNTSKIQKDEKVSSSDSPRTMVSRSPSIISKDSKLSLGDDSSSIHAERIINLNINGQPTTSEIKFFNFLKGKANDVKPQNAAMHHWKTIKMLSTVLACFYVCWVPFTVKMVITIFYSVKTEPDWLGIFEEFAASALYMNSFLNPIIYAGMNLRFRLAFMKVLHINPKAKMVQRTESAKNSSRLHL